MNSEQDDETTIVWIDHASGQITIDYPDLDQICIPTSLVKVKSKVADDGIASITLRFDADELHVRPAPPKDVVITNVPDPVTPEQAYEAQLRTIQRQAGYDA
ncbi:hypothetical protein [Gordonia sp. SND2]|uniref:hypothetical protein n=1 Tax=Gordonia sp. SND2 TaxID=3388659 RepID=UPI00398B6E5F